MNRIYIACFICIMSMFIVQKLYTAWIDNVPNKLAQPDRTVIDVFYSGDEHHNWIHDKDLYTMIRDPKTGYVCWAMAVKGDLVSTGKPVHLYTPQSLNLTPKDNISPERYRQKRHRIDDYHRDSSTRAPSTGEINLLVIFIRFSDDEEYTGQTTYYDGMYNATGDIVNSLRQYYNDASYQQLIVNSFLFPIPMENTILSYQDIYPRNYYLPYNEVTNPDGYNDEQGTEADNDEMILPTVTALEGNFPNPFNPETMIRFSLAREDRVSLDIYNLRGQRVRSVINGVYGAGDNSVVWNGCDEQGQPVSSGVYFYRMATADYSAVKKMLLLK